MISKSTHLQFASKPFVFLRRVVVSLMVVTLLAPTQIGTVFAAEQANVDQVKDSLSKVCNQRQQETDAMKQTVDQSDSLPPELQSQLSDELGKNSDVLGQLASNITKADSMDDLQAIAKALDTQQADSQTTNESAKAVNVLDSQKDVTTQLEEMVKGADSLVKSCETDPTNPDCSAAAADGSADYGQMIQQVMQVIKSATAIIESVIALMQATQSGGGTDPASMALILQTIIDQLATNSGMLDGGQGDMQQIIDLLSGGSQGGGSQPSSGGNSGGGNNSGGNSGNSGGGNSNGGNSNSGSNGGSQQQSTQAPPIARCSASDPVKDQWADGDCTPEAIAALPFYRDDVSDRDCKTYKASDGKTYERVKWVSDPNFAGTCLYKIQGSQTPSSSGGGNNGSSGGNSGSSNGNSGSQSGNNSNSGSNGNNGGSNGGRPADYNAVCSGETAKDRNGNSWVNTVDTQYITIGGPQYTCACPSGWSTANDWCIRRATQGGCGAQTAYPMGITNGQTDSGKRETRCMTSGSSNSGSPAPAPAPSGNNGGGGSQDDGCGPTAHRQNPNDLRSQCIGGPSSGCSGQPYDPVDGCLGSTTNRTPAQEYALRCTQAGGVIHTSDNLCWKHELTPEEVTDSGRSCPRGYVYTNDHSQCIKYTKLNV